MKRRTYSAMSFMDVILLEDVSCDEADEKPTQWKRDSD
jgi:hypothetical protein